MLVEQAVLRSNPRYELVLLDRLEQDERGLLGEEADGRNVPYGLLRPLHACGLEPRLVSTDTALLFLTLRQPSPCPEYVRRGLGDRLATTIGRLVIDGILEVEQDGEFRAGAAGWAPLAHQPPTGHVGRAGEISVEAVRHGQGLLALADLPAELVASRLYMYGRQPLTPGLRRRMPSDEAVASFLGVGSSGLRVALGTAWRATRPSAESPWRSWSPRRQLSGGQHPVSFKLYVSPGIDSLPVAFAVVVSELADARGVLGFKVARSAEGLARPDKMVAYFASLDALSEGAARIREGMAGCQPHGVPFTAAVTEDGLLTWAIDPPREERVGKPGRASWRSWVTSRLADYLVSARGGPLEGPEPWEVALARLALDGVDSTTWIPDPAIFDYAAAG